MTYQFTLTPLYDGRVGSLGSIKERKELDRHHYDMVPPPLGREQASHPSPWCSVQTSRTIFYIFAAALAFVAATNAEVPTDTMSTRSSHNTAGRIVPPVEMGVYLRLLLPLAQSTASEETFAEATSFVQAYMSEGKVPFSSTDVVLWSLPREAHVVHRVPTLPTGCAGRVRLSQSGRRRHQDHQGRVRCPAEDRRHRCQGPTDTHVVELLDPVLYRPEMT
jgi:hypothetical protein